MQPERPDHRPGDGSASSAESSRRPCSGLVPSRPSRPARARQRAPRAHHRRRRRGTHPAGVQAATGRWRLRTTGRTRSRWPWAMAGAPDMADDGMGGQGFGRGFGRGGSCRSAQARRARCSGAMRSRRSRVSAIAAPVISLTTDDGWTRDVDTTGVTITRNGQTITLADVHVGDDIRLGQTRNADGTWTVTQLEVLLAVVQGTVASVGTDSFTVTEADGSVVTVRVADTTRWVARRGNARRPRQPHGGCPGRCRGRPRTRMVRSMPSPWPSGVRSAPADMPTVPAASPRRRRHRASITTVSTRSG